MNFDELKMFADEQLTNTIKPTLRGKNDSTMYFLIPKDIRNLINHKNVYNFNIINCKKDKYLVIKLK